MPRPYIFDKYDPKQDCYPAELEWECVGASDIAQSILKRRSRADTTQIIWDLDVAVMKTNGGLPSLEDTSKLTRYGGSMHVNYLARQMSLKRPIELTSGIPAIQWAELYAVAALAQLTFAQHDAELIKTRTPQLSEQNLYAELMYELGLNVIYAASAAGMARALAITVGLQGWQDPSATEKRLRQDIASSGGEGRSEKYRPLERKVIELWTAHYQHHSNSAAAEHISARLQKDYPQLLEPAPVKVRTIANWIGKHKASKLNLGK